MLWCYIDILYYRQIDEFAPQGRHWYLEAAEGPLLFDNSGFFFHLLFQDSAMNANVSVDMTNALAFIDKVQADKGIKLTPTILVGKAIAESLLVPIFLCFFFLLHHR